MENEYLSLEGVRKILHISKRKCAWMLQNGVIPCEISGKKTRCYKVLRKDVEQYIIMCRQNPGQTFFRKYSPRLRATQPLTNASGPLLTASANGSLIYGATRKMR